MSKVAETTSHEFKTLTDYDFREGVCFYREGKKPAGAVIAAPHEGYDLYTSAILKDFAATYPKAPTVYCEGFRENNNYDVNRPSGDAVKTPADRDHAQAIMEYYLDNQITANRGKLPQRVYEIHGKGNKKHPHSELALIGDPKSCGWTDDSRVAIKKIFTEQTGLSALVYGLDEGAYLAHSEYQKEGLAAQNGYCGVNIELSQEARAPWNPETPATDLTTPAKAKLIGALGSLIAYSEKTWDISNTKGIFDWISDR